MYSFDTSAFVNPARRHYPFDVAPSLWRALEERIATGAIVASTQVKAEIDEKDDDLKAWTKSQTGLFLPMDAAQVSHTRRILEQFQTWVDPDSGKNDADPFVVALAQARNLTVVSDEKGGSAGKPKIPYVCAHFKVRHLRVIDFIREIKLVW